MLLGIVGCPVIPPLYIMYQEWIAQLRDKLKTMQEIACEKESQAIVTMKKNYDVNAKPREYEERTLALLRTPDLGGKLSDMWDGPYEIIRKVTPVTYELAVPNRRSKRLIVHSYL